jgi:hypothetical protein
MDCAFKERFIGLRDKFFDGAPLPAVFHYTDNEGAPVKAKAPTGPASVRISLPLPFLSADSLPWWKTWKKVFSLRKAGVW